VFRLGRYDNVSDALATLHWLRLLQRVDFKVAVMSFHMLPERMTSKTATNQNGHMIMVIGEHVNKYLSLNKLGIIKSRTETMPEVGFKRNALH